MLDASPKKRHKFALAAFILGVVSIVIPSLVPCAIVALVLGIKTIKQVNRDPANLGGKGLAIAGVATAGTSIFFLAIIAIGILVPTTVKYAQSAKLRRATEDVRVIGTAKGNFYKKGDSEVNTHTKNRADFHIKRILTAILFGIVMGVGGGILSVLNRKGKIQNKDWGNISIVASGCCLVFVGAHLKFHEIDPAGDWDNVLAIVCIVFGIGTVFSNPIVHGKDLY